MAEGFARSLIKHSTEEEFDSDVVSEDVKIAAAGDESDLYDVVFENDSYRICKPKAAEGYQILASGTRWLSGRWSFNSRTDGYDEIDDGYGMLGFHYSPASDYYSDKYIIIDKKNPKRKWQFIRGLGELRAPSQATYSCATWVVKNGDEDMWRWFISQKFPYISNGVDKKVGGKLIADRTVFRYPDDMKEITFAARRTSNIASVEFAPGVTSIRAGAFAGLEKVREIVIPDGVKSIGNRAFAGCASLERVVLPDSVEKIGNRAFYFCDSLRSIKLPQGLKSLGEGAFCYSGITRIPDMPSGIKEIPAMCFCMGQIKTAIIPDGIEKIGRMAFYGCAGLDYVYIPKSVSTIEGDPFMAQHFSAIQKESRISAIDCEADSKPPHWDAEWSFVGYDRRDGEYVNVSPEINWGVPSPRKSVSESFSLDRDTTDFDPEVIEYTGNIDDWTAQVDLRENLGVLPAVRKLIVDDGVRDISMLLNLRVFDNLEEVVLPDSVDEIGEFAFSRCPRLASVNIPDGVTCISRSAFVDCKSLKSINIPDSVTEIGVYALDGCPLRSIYLPKSVETIRPYALPSSCSIYCELPVRPRGWDSYAWRNDPSRVVEWGVSREEYERIAGEDIRESFMLEREPAEFDVDTIEYNGNMDDWQNGVNIRSYYGMEPAVRRLIVAPGVTELPELNLRIFENLEEVVLPKSLTKIDGGAFLQCRYLRSVDIPAGVTAIGETAFFDCESLTSINIPDGVVSIGYSAFSGCTSMTSVTIPGSVRSIGDNAFRFCSSLRSVTIPDSVKFIGRMAFYYCSSLTSVVIPDSVRSIDYGAFWGCSSLASVTISDSVTSIGDYAFEDCGQLASVYIPASVRDMGRHAIPPECAVYCGAATMSPSGWWHNWHSRATRNVFWRIDRNGYERMIKRAAGGVDEAFELSKDGDFDGTLTYDGDPEAWNDTLIAVVETGEVVTKVIVADGVDKIPDDFNYAKDGSNLTLALGSVTEVIIPDSVVEIGTSAFYGCESLESVHIPNGVVSIGDYAFCRCESLESVDIPGSVASIGEWAFRDCKSLRSVTIPDSVASIGIYAFLGCESLESVYIPDSVKYIGSYAFGKGCAAYCGASSLPEEWVVDWHGGDEGNVKWDVSREEYESMTSLGESFSLEKDSANLDHHTIKYDGDMDAWEELVELYTNLGYNSVVDKLVVAPGVKELPDLELALSFPILKEVVLPDSLTEIGRNAFRQCDCLESVDIPSGVASIGDGAFSHCSSITSVTIPDSVTSIGDSAFRFCKYLTSITIPNGVTSLEYYVFGGCDSLESVSIPNSVTFIGQGAFSGCMSLKSVTIPDSVTSIDAQAFSYCERLRDVYIPDSVTSIGRVAFSDCYALKSIYIPESVRNMEKYAIPASCAVYCGAPSQPGGWSNYWHAYVYTWHEDDRVFWGVGRGEYGRTKGGDAA